MTDLFQLNDEVEINQEDMVLLDKAWINRIKKLAQENSSGKYRTCIHQSEKDNVHEMLIIHSASLLQIITNLPDKRLSLNLLRLIFEVQISVFETDQ